MDYMRDKYSKKNDKLYKYNSRIFVILLVVLLFCLISFTAVLTGSLLSGYSYKVTPVVDGGSIVFSFNETEKHISLNNAFPISDDAGRVLMDDNQFYEFNIAVDFKENSNFVINYELSLIEGNKNTLESKYVKLYLLENNNPVVLSLVSSLNNSIVRDGAKVIYKNSFSETGYHNYVLKAWLDNSYPIDSISRSFEFYIAVDAY